MPYYDHSASYPVPPTDEWDILDSTKLTCFQACPRRYFYNYVLGWQPENVSNHLTFGKAWHAALEHLYDRGNSVAPEHLKAAYYKFWLGFLAREGEESTGITEADLRMDYSHLAPKDPGTALTALEKYIETYASDNYKYKTLYTEVSGIVPINEEDVLHIRMDVITQDLQTGNLCCFEHKTASTQSKQWREQWLMAMQIGTYTHALHCLAGAFGTPNATGNVIVNGTFFRKGGIGFERVNVYKSIDMLQTWLVNANWWADALKQEFENLSECSESAQVMQAFPMNTTSCTDYGGCPFLDFCTIWSNPLRRCSSPPPGMTIRHWDPTKAENAPKVAMDLLAGTITEIGKGEPSNEPSPTE